MGQLVKSEAEQLRHCVGQISNWQSNSNLMASNRKERMLPQRDNEKERDSGIWRNGFPRDVQENKSSRKRKRLEWSLTLLLAGALFLTFRACGRSGRWSRHRRCRGCPPFRPWLFRRRRPFHPWYRRQRLRPFRPRQ